MSQDTKLTILDTAEMLFAQHGINGVSLRKIISEAGVNLAAVHYHFGSKDALVRAVFGRRITAVNEERMRGLNELRSVYGSEPIPVKELLEVFLSAPLNLGQDAAGGGKNFFRLVARAHAETNEVVSSELFVQLKNIIDEFLGEFRRAIPDLSEKERAMRLMFVAGAMVQAVLMPFKPQFEKEFVGDKAGTREMLDMLVQFCAGGMKYSEEVGG